MLGDCIRVYSDLTILWILLVNAPSTVRSICTTPDAVGYNPDQQPLTRRAINFSLRHPYQTPLSPPITTSPLLRDAQLSLGRVMEV